MSRHWNAAQKLSHYTSIHHHVYKIHLVKKFRSGLLWHTPFIPVLGKHRPIGLCEFKASQNYIVGVCLKTKNKTKQKPNKKTQNKQQQPLTFWMILEQKS